MLSSLATPYKRGVIHSSLQPTLYEGLVRSEYSGTPSSRC